MGDPKPGQPPVEGSVATQPGTDAPQQINNAEGQFADITFDELLEFDPAVAGEMADNCSGASRTGQNQSNPFLPDYDDFDYFSEENEATTPDQSDPDDDGPNTVDETDPDITGGNEKTDNSTFTNKDSSDSADDDLGTVQRDGEDSPEKLNPVSSVETSRKASTGTSSPEEREVNSSTARDDNTSPSTPASPILSTDTSSSEEREINSSTVRDDNTSPSTPASPILSTEASSSEEPEIVPSTGRDDSTRRPTTASPILAKGASSLKEQEVVSTKGLDDSTRRSSTASAGFPSGISSPKDQEIVATKGLDDSIRRSTTPSAGLSNGTSSPKDQEIVATKGLDDSIRRSTTPSAGFSNGTSPPKDQEIVATKGLDDSIRRSTTPSAGFSNGTSPPKDQEIVATKGLDDSIRRSTNPSAGFSNGTSPPKDQEIVATKGLDDNIRRPTTASAGFSNGTSSPKDQEIVAAKGLDDSIRRPTTASVGFAEVNPSKGQDLSPHSTPASPVLAARASSQEREIKPSTGQDDNLSRSKSASPLLANDASSFPGDASRVPGVPSTQSARGLSEQNHDLTSAQKDKPALTSNQPSTQTNSLSTETSARNQATSERVAANTNDSSVIATSNDNSKPTPVLAANQPANAIDTAQLSRQSVVPGTDTAQPIRQLVSNADATPTARDFTGISSATGIPGADAITASNAARIGDVANANALAANQSSILQMIEAMERNTSLSRESNPALIGSTSPLSVNTFSYPPSMQLVDATGKSIIDNMGQLLLRESGGIYNPSTANSTILSSANALGNAGIGNVNLGNGNISAANLGNPNLTNALVPGVTKEGQTAIGATNSQGITQAFQGLMQQGQGTVKLDESGKPIAVGPGGPALTDALTATTGSKKGALGTTEGTITGAIGIPLVPTTKVGSLTDAVTEIKVPGTTTTNPTNTNIIVTAAAGATATGQTGVAGVDPKNPNGSTTGGTGTTGTTTATGTQDPNATDIKSLVTALPTVQIIDSKKLDNTEDDGTGRPEIDFDSSESNDFDDDDDYVDTPVIEGRRADSKVITAPKKPANIGISIVENIMVLINDLKNQKVDEKTAQKMWADLFSDLFGKQKRQPCMVKPEDSLEHIARYVLKDARLAPLLYTINVKAKNIKPIKEGGNVGAVKADTDVLVLPHRSEILRYKIHVLKDASALVSYAKSNKAAQREFSAYRCREGDTLKSIAAAHPDLQDENMWADIALANGLSVRVDKGGNPIAKLKEGQLLQIPKAIARDELEDDEDLAESEIKHMNLVSPIANLDMGIGDEETVNKTLAKMEKRIITQDDLGSGKDKLLIKLQLKAGDQKMNVAVWDVNATASNLKLYDRFGSCKLIPIALPTRAARELAENNLKANAERYCKMFLTGELAA